jgi:hypothetical protein
MLIMAGPAWWDFVGKVKVALIYITLVINAAVYNLIDFAYQVFMAISSAKIFTDETIKSFANRVYIIIGVIALFIIAYALLRAIVDPDGAGKGEMAPGKIVSNVLKAIILIAFVPTIFNFVYQMQDVILGTDVICKILIGDNYTRNYQKSDNSSSSTSFINTAGKNLSNLLFKSFLTPSNTTREAGKKESDILAGDCDKNCLIFFPNGEASKPSYQEISDTIDNGTSFTYTVTDNDGKNQTETSTAGVDLYTNLTDNVYTEELSFNPIVQFIVGLVVVYVFISYCIDMGVRAVKLGYFELIAPFPILTIIIPGQKKIFDNWLKATISTFADVFVKIAIMFFGMLLIQNLPDITGDLWANSFIGTPSTAVRVFARIFVIIGILIFIKQAPQLISDITGIKAGSFKLGIGDKLGEMAFIGGLANKGQGLISGALGAGYSSKLNGGSFIKGAKYGAAQGWKDGATTHGHQFNAQRQGIYSSVGYKGKAGWFGGQSLMDKWVDDSRDKYTDDYKDRVLSARINAQTDRTKAGKFKDQYDYEMQRIHGANEAAINEKEAELTSARQDLARMQANDAQERNQARQKFEEEKEQRMAGLQKNLADAQTAFTASQKTEVDGLTSQLQTLKTRLIQKGADFTKDAEVINLQGKIDAARKRVFDSTSYAEAIKNCSNSNFESTAEYKNLEAQITERNASTFEKIADLNADISRITDHSELKDHIIKRYEYNAQTKKLEEHSEEVTKDVYDAYTAAIGDLEDADETFKNQNKVYNARIKEKANQAWLNSEEGQHMTSAFTQAEKNAHKGEGAPKPPPSGNGGDKK